MKPSHRSVTQRAPANGQGHGRRPEPAPSANPLLGLIPRFEWVCLCATDETQLLRETCRVISELGGYRLVWVGLPQPEAQMRIMPAAQVGFDMLQIEGFHLSLTTSGGPIETAMRTLKPCIISDTLHDPYFMPWRDVVLKPGAGSFIALPMVAGDQALGVLSICGDEPDAFDGGRSELFARFAEDLARWVLALRNRAAPNKAEEQLRQGNALFRVIVENVSDLVALVDAHGNRLYNSPSYGSILGDPAQLRGTESFAEIHPDDRERVREVFRQTVATGVGRRSEYRFLLKDGTVRYIESHGTPILDASGAVKQVLVVSRDVTERKRAEAEHVVLEEQLRQAQKLESIGTLAGGIAHDFNNILSIILGFTTLLDRNREDPEAHRRVLETIDSTIRRGAALTRQLLTFARKTSVTSEPVDVNRTIADLAKMLQATFPETISIVVQPDAQLPSLTADAGQIHQALLNLCLNSRDAMPAGGTITLGTSVAEGDILRARFPSADSERYVCVQVSDTGTGMDEPVRRRIFEPFFTTKGEGKGTGLGLAVVYGVVKGHHGFIDLDTAPGKGTTFSLYFPAVAAETRVGASVTVPTPAEEKGHGETILVVEDESTLLGLVKDLLEGSGYAVLTAADGAEAVELYRTRKSDIALVVSDVGLPRQSGLEAFLRMKEINPDVKVVFASGYLEPELRDVMDRHGAEGFVQKPYVPGDMLRTLRSVLDRHP